MTAMPMPWPWDPESQGTEDQRGCWDPPRMPGAGERRGESRRSGKRGRGRREGRDRPGPWNPWMAMEGPQGPPGFPQPPNAPHPPHGGWPGAPWPHPGHALRDMRRGGGGRGRGPRARRGDVRAGILVLLAEEPRSGYEIIREGKERSGGGWRPSPGSVYPMLQQLEDEGLVRQADSGEGRRRPYELTDEGRDYVEENAASLTPPWETVPEEFEDAQARYAEIAGLAAQLSAAAGQVAQAGTTEQLEQAKDVLARGKRQLYRILAEDDGDEGTGEDAGAGNTAETEE